MKYKVEYHQHRNEKICQNQTINEKEEWYREKKAMDLVPNPEECQLTREKDRNNENQ
jgi:hypothetical protein